MKHFIDRLMARLGYVPAAALDALAKPGSIPLKIEVDNSQVRESLALLEQMTSAAAAAELALAQLREAAPNVGLSITSPLPDPPAGRSGYWLQLVGAKLPIWIDSEPPVRTPVHSFPGSTCSRSEEAR